MAARPIRPEPAGLQVAIARIELLLTDSNYEHAKKVIDSLRDQTEDKRRENHLLAGAIDRTRGNTVIDPYLLALRLVDTDMIERTRAILEKNLGVETVGDLLQQQSFVMLAIDNFGEKMLEEVYRTLSGLGIEKQDVFHLGCN